MSRLVVFIAGSIIGFGLASCAEKTGCTSSAECRAKEACLPSGLCVATCATQADCLPTEKCSTTGGCVSLNGGCGTRSDCQAGSVCQQGGSCSVVSAGGGWGGIGGGSTGVGGGSGSTGGGSAGTGGSGQCGEVFTSTGAEATLMIVLDKSKSMNSAAGSGTKWGAAVAAVKQMISKYPNTHFGLEMFSMPSGDASKYICTPDAGVIFVPIGAGAGQAISDVLPAKADGNGTPIAMALTIAGADPGLSNASRSNGVVLITDGQENCEGDPVSVVKELFARPVNVRTWIVGFGSSSDDVDPDMLSTMAVAGGTARLTTPRYYQADVEEDLSAALQAISNAAQRCSFKLSQAPGDLSKLFIGINGQLVPLDTTRVSGWDYDKATNRVTLYGPACDALANTPGAQLSVVYGCSDGLVDGGVDGGFDFGVDAGEIG